MRNSSIKAASLFLCQLASKTIFHHRSLHDMYFECPFLWETAPTVDGRNPAPTGMYFPPCKQWDIYHISWLAGFQPSTVYQKKTIRKSPLYPHGCFLNWWYPRTMGFPTKNDHFGVFWGYHHLRKHPDPSIKCKQANAKAPEIMSTVRSGVDLLPSNVNLTPRGWLPCPG